MEDNFRYNINNKVTLIGVINGEGASFNSDCNIYCLCIKRKALDIEKDCGLDFTGMAFDRYNIFVKKGVNVKDGSLVRIKGRLCQKEGFGDSSHYTCPVCKAKQDDKIMLMGICVKKISVLNDTDGYQANLSKTLEPEIRVSNVWIDNVLLLRDENCGDITCYSPSSRCLCEFYHKGLDEKINERFEIGLTENNISYICSKKYYEKKGYIIKGKGKMALAQDNSKYLLCHNCKQEIAVSYITPIVELESLDFAEEKTSKNLI